LEESYKALEDAGYSNPLLLSGQQVGTIIGTMGDIPAERDFSHFSMLGSDTSILASRLAYFLNLKGPALSINTACSSSLTAIDFACGKLKSREIDLAVAGGITIYTHPGSFISMNNAGMLSATGGCRPYDSAADGIVVGDGVGIVILKRLNEARQDGDHIYGVIRGIGTNQDGRTTGITVPSFLSQSKLEESIYRKHKINVEDIQYIEGHGTGTKLGDPIEIHALSHAFKKFTPKKQFCAIGAVKANIGHTSAAAGVMSVIKVLLSLKYKQIPPSINFEKENEHIDFANSPVFVNTSLK
ncbi:MAG: polyketide synthase, partial [candidate division Zixibacteria bacterium]|nr:polyketide synthase [candidate division Zixibacteria bacterium]